MGFSLFPKNERFFDLFALSASNIRVAAEQLLNLVQDFTQVEQKAARLKDVETEGDQITHQIIDFLNTAFTGRWVRRRRHRGAKRNRRSARCCR